VTCRPDSSSPCSIHKKHLSARRDVLEGSIIVTDVLTIQKQTRLPANLFLPSVLPSLGHLHAPPTSQPHPYHTAWSDLPSSDFSYSLGATFEMRLRLEPQRCPRSEVTWLTRERACSCIVSSALLVTLTTSPYLHPNTTITSISNARTFLHSSALIGLCSKGIPLVSRTLSLSAFRLVPQPGRNGICAVCRLECCP
jgi:hypothetical protein